MVLYRKLNLSGGAKFPSYRKVSVAKDTFLVAWLALSTLLWDVQLPLESAHSLFSYTPSKLFQH